MPIDMKAGLDSGGLPRLAPDLTYPGDRASGGTSYKRISGIDGSAGYVTALSLTGKFYISYLEFSLLTAEIVDIRLTIDGVVIWDGGYTAGTSGNPFFGAQSGSPGAVAEFMICKTSFLLEIQTTTDNSARVEWLARPIL